MKRSTLCAVLAVALFGSSLSALAAKGSVEIRNRSSWQLHNLYVSDAGEDDWGPDQLGDDIIDTGDTFTLTNIACGVYDIQLVDEDGDACELYDVKLCSDKLWDITDKELLSCQADTDQ